MSAYTLSQKNLGNLECFKFANLLPGSCIIVVRQFNYTHTLNLRHHYY